MAPEKQERGRVVNREVINDVLVNLFNEILRLEEEAIITDKYKDISNNDMHIIAAVGEHGAKSMSAVAKIQKVTVGTLTIAVNSLVKKGYITRVRSEEDRRVVLVSLTEKGKKAFRHHEKFHEDMIQATLKDLSPDETKVLVKALTNLCGFFQQKSGESPASK